jgi:hypothetical protein
MSDVINDRIRVNFAFYHLVTWKKEF